MTLNELVKYLRYNILDDYVMDWEDITEADEDSQLLWSNESLTQFINEAEKMAARSARLIRDYNTYTITTVIDQSDYAINSKIIEVIDIDSTTSGNLLTKIEFDDVKGIQNWRTSTGTPNYYIVDYETNSIRLYPIPQAVDTLNLTVFRLPTDELDWESNNRSPEIREEYHIPMLNYAAHLAFNKQDVDAFDPEKAIVYLQLFEKEFSSTSAYSETRKRRQGCRTTKYGGL